MELKHKVMVSFLCVFVVSIILNMVLLKYRVQVNFIGGGSGTKMRAMDSRLRGNDTGPDFYNDFENGFTGGWKGRITGKIVPQGSKYALEIPKVNNPYFATAAGKTFENKGLKVGNNTRVEFDYYIKDASVLRIQCYSPKRRDNFFFNIKNPELGKWKRVSVGFAAFKDNASWRMAPKRGDELSSIQIYGGRAGEDTVLVIDNFRIVEG